MDKTVAENMPAAVTSIVTAPSAPLSTQVLTSISVVSATATRAGETPQIRTITAIFSRTVVSAAPSSDNVLSTQQNPSSKSSETSSTASPSVSPLKTSSPSIGSGAIAGIAIAAVLLIALIIGGWYVWRRRKQKTQTATATLTDNELARREGDGEKIVLDPHQSAPTTGAYQTQYQEMSGNGLTQELDRSHSYKYAIGGAHELKAEDRPGELPFAGVDDGRDGVVEETVGGPRIDNTAAQASHVSPHVEAQRRREVEWLEAEETRMRQRREALLQQGGGTTP